MGVMLKLVLSQASRNGGRTYVIFIDACVIVMVMRNVVGIRWGQEKCDFIKREWINVLIFFSLLQMIV